MLAHPDLLISLDLGSGVYESKYTANEASQCSPA